MANNNFEKDLKSKLSDWKVDYDPSSWDQMNAHLDEALGVDETSQVDNEFDQNLIEKLEGHQTPYKSADWENLSNKLDKEDSIQRRIIKIAALQFVVVFLVFLSLWNWKGAEMVHIHKEKQAQKTALSFAFAQQQENFYQQFLTDLEARNNFASTTAPLLEFAKIANRIKNETSKISNLELEDQTIELLQNALVINKQSQPMAMQFSKEEDILEVNNSMVTADAKIDLTVVDLSIENIEALANVTPNIDYENEVLKEPKFVLLNIEPEKKKTEFSVGGLFSPDLYVIRSPEDPVYHYSGHYSDSYGLSGGISFSARKKSLELESGILYSSVSYKPREIPEFYASEGRAYETYLNDILFNVISVPLQLKKHFNIGKSSTFYALAGTSFNGIINSNFDIHLEQLEILDPLTEGFAENKPQLDKKDFDPGLFEGGSIFDNAFVTADLGIGFQQLVSNKFSFYVQPTLHTQFTNGIGPNNDKLHKLSVYLGAKYHFNTPKS